MTWEVINKNKCLIIRRKDLASILLKFSKFKITQKTVISLISKLSGTNIIVCMCFCNIYVTFVLEIEG